MTSEDQQFTDLENDLAALTPASPSGTLEDRLVSALVEDASREERLLQDLESELSILAPVAPTAELSGRIMNALQGDLPDTTAEGKIVEFRASSPSEAAPAMRGRFSARYLLTVAALLSIATLLVFKLLDDLWPPQSPESSGGGYVDAGSPETKPVSPPPVKGTPVSTGYRPTRIENDVVDSWVEGIYRGADDQMYQKVVRKFMDTVEYKDQKTGRTIRVQKPRLQTVYVPVDGPF